jgi:sec-independent protein translocase protein TatC
VTQAPPSPHAAPADDPLDPDEARMTIGEHLDELRSRLIRSLVGFVLAAAVCFALSERVIAIFCRPLIRALQHNNLNPQLIFMRASDPFMVYIEVTLISAAVLASPWILYQVWQFVAAGLYPAERRYVTKYLPLSVGLLLSGVAVLYFLVLPVSLEFFIQFGMRLPLKLVDTPPARVQPAHPLSRITQIPGDPISPLDGDMWFDTTRSQLKMFHSGEIRVIPFGPTTLTAPMITLPEYVDMVVQLLVAFGLSFQLPLVVLALERVGIVDLDMLRSLRRYVYFAMAVVAAFIVPDVVSGMLALMVPLIGLYEFGIILAGRRGKSPQSRP